MRKVMQCALCAEVEFDFRVPNVHSINTSGHKYGLVYPGVGWVVWRNRSCVDESLICKPRNFDLSCSIA